MRTDIETPETHIATVRPRRRSWLLLIPALAVLGIAGGAYTSAQAQTAEADRCRAGRRLWRAPARAAARQGERHRQPAQSDRGDLERTAAAVEVVPSTAPGGAPADRRCALGADINPATVEQLRKQAMGIADQLSSTFTQGLVQTAQVLTPDQRKTAAAAIAEARGRFQHHHGKA